MSLPWQVTGKFKDMVFTDGRKWDGLNLDTFVDTGFNKQLNLSSKLIAASSINSSSPVPCNM